MENGMSVKTALLLRQLTPNDPAVVTSNIIITDDMDMYESYVVEELKQHRIKFVNMFIEFSKARWTIQIVDLHNFGANVEKIIDLEPL